MRVIIIIIIIITLVVRGRYLLFVGGGGGGGFEFIHYSNIKYTYKYDITLYTYNIMHRRRRGETDDDRDDVLHRHRR